MASRNERKRAAKAREQKLRLAVEQAFALASKKVEIVQPRQDVYDIPNAIRGHREPRERLGMVTRGKFMAMQPKAEAKRKLVYSNQQGKAIERAIRPSGSTKPR